MAATRSRISIASHRKAGLNEVGFSGHEEQRNARDEAIDRELDRLTEASEWSPVEVNPDLYRDQLGRLEESEFSAAALDAVVRRVADEMDRTGGRFPRQNPIAWYEGYPCPASKPWANGRWGIFWNESLFLDFVVYLCLKARVANLSNSPEAWQRAIKEVAHIARANIRRHELTHHSIEIACRTAQALDPIAGQAGRPYVSSGYFGKRAFIEEILASREEMRANETNHPSVKDAAISKAIRDAYENAPRSGPYAAWRLAESLRGRLVVAKQLALSLGWPAAAGAVILREVDQNQDEVPEHPVNPHGLGIKLP
jgi:hypothetical protein